MPDRDRISLIGLVLETALGLQRTLGPTTEATIGVGGQAFEICIRLYRSEGRLMRMTDLATQTGVSPSGLTRAVDRLVAEGLIRREVCDADRRGTYAVLTELGESKMTKALELHREEVDGLLSGVLSRQEESVLGDLLERLRDRVNPDAAFVS